MSSMAPLNPNAPVYFPTSSPASSITFFHASMNKEGRNVSMVKSQHKLQDDLELFHFKDEQEDDEKRTTVMIKNLPNKLMKSTLLKMLDDHCVQENKDVEENSTVVSEFNFLYLPIDFKSGSNLGYAFVNFTSAKAARRFYHAYHNRSWNQLHGSLKICEVTYARIQGLPALQKRFKNSVFICDNEDYLPVYFNPSRNGSRDSNQHFIGRIFMKL